MPVTLDKVTLSADAAKRAFTRTEINVETAERIVNACEISPKHVTVRPASSSSAHPETLCTLYGWTDRGRSISRRPTGKPKPLSTCARPRTRRGIGTTSLDAKISRASLDLFMQPGGFPIIVENQIIGAIGVGGFGQEEECAHAALTKVLGPQPPMAPNIPFGGIGGRQGGAAPASGDGQGRGRQ